MRKWISRAAAAVVVATLGLGVPVAAHAEERKPCAAHQQRGRRWTHADHDRRGRRWMGADQVVRGRRWT